MGKGIGKILTNYAVNKLEIKKSELSKART
jgi:hypothetical protein